MSDDGHHVCQRCSQVSAPPACPAHPQPLQLAPLSPAHYSLISSSLPDSPASSIDDWPPFEKLAALPPSSRQSAKVWADANLSTPGAGSSRHGGRSVAESFILLSDSALYPKPSPSPSIQNPPHASHLSAQLHSILSGNTPISHPLCTECTASLTAEFQKKAEELGKERDAYIGFEQGILRNREKLKSKVPSKAKPGLGGHDVEGTDAEWAALTRRKKELQDEEEQLKAILEGKEKELDVAEHEEELAKAEEEEVEREENDFLLSHSALSTHLSHLTSSLNTAQTSLLLSRTLLAHLESTNVYNDAFQIGHVPLSPSSSSNVTVGTINGLRLGGRPVVEWEEINAAWGLVALCLHRIADKVGCVFDTYKVVPLGSYSRIEELPPSKSSYELYASSDITPARILQNRRFNHAMMAFLDCLRQLIEFGKKEDKAWAMGNIEIHKDKISNHSIRLPGISSMPLGLPSMSIMGLGVGDTSAKDKSSASDATAEEAWTRACRTVLGVLKRILVMESEADRGAIGA
ncbi:beclin 1 [Cryptococcus wingfieldii CBS 7118]|uniref:Beclin 1 n=1 Tax=Cryptococcus wingfieldii CBS 7118 TaxID=1295528 RepID=A0A1E3K1Y0_9TREE|nr:beclin 1 [Cryptococcus wingfieldii CBS 7118]ODO07168.1 beclin 1 [Cryptococcus wingfieldii CBS 7118]